jgi:septal ring-binding cell division protein DamX
VEPTKTEVPQPTPVPTKKPVKLEIGTSVSERLETLRRGDMDTASKQGEKLLKETHRGQWSLRLEIACKGDTIQRAVGVFPDGKPDLFILPITLRDGRSCYQVFYGHFSSEGAAEKQVHSLPSIFREGANRPKPFKISEIPGKQ